MYYANTREDAAKVGFDDDLIYDEVARPIGDRQMPATRLLGAEAFAVFQEWETLPDKVPY